MSWGSFQLKQCTSWATANSTTRIPNFCFGHPFLPAPNAIQSKLWILASMEPAYIKLSSLKLSAFPPTCCSSQSPTGSPEVEFLRGFHNPIQRSPPQKREEPQTARVGGWSLSVSFTTACKWSTTTTNYVVDNMRDDSRRKSNQFRVSVLLGFVSG
jgi:hypothetical protein